MWAQMCAHAAHKYTLIVPPLSETRKEICYLLLCNWFNNTSFKLHFQGIWVEVVLSKSGQIDINILNY